MTKSFSAELTITQVAMDAFDIALTLDGREGSCPISRRLVDNYPSAMLIGADWLNTLSANIRTTTADVVMPARQRGCLLRSMAGEEIEPARAQAATVALDSAMAWSRGSIASHGLDATLSAQISVFANVAALAGVDASIIQGQLRTFADMLPQMIADWKLANRKPANAEARPI